MKKTVMAIMFLILAQGLAFGQTSKERKGWGYVFAGGGTVSDGGTSEPLVNVGGGGEGIIGKGFGVGGEMGYFTVLDRGSNGLGLASANVSYHFNRSQKLVPFITGGGSVAFRSGAIGGGNIGGGLHYWLSNNLGLRFEARDFIFSSDRPHTLTFRVGLSFR